MKFKGTEGEWKCSEIMIFSDSLISFIETDKQSIAQLRGCVTGKEIEAFANARLIASAPKLLKIAIETLHDMNGLRTQRRLNENGIKKHDELKELINYIMNEH